MGPPAIVATGQQEGLAAEPTLEPIALADVAEPGTVGNTLPRAGARRVEGALGSAGLKLETVVSTQALSDLHAVNTFAGFFTTTTRVNVRAGPGTTFRRLRSLAAGTQIRVEGEENGWYSFRDDNGALRFLSGRYVQAAGGKESN